jgi:hypothetical protein
MHRRRFIKSSALAAVVPLLPGKLPASGKPEVKHGIPQSGDFPRLWYTDAQLRRVGERIASGNAFLTAAYAEVLRRAEEAATRRSSPCGGPDPKKFRDAMRQDAQYPNLFLVGRRRYPDDPVIAEVCRQADTGIFVRSGHYEVFSYALAYGYGRL